jgi:hypothetical protein
VTRRFGVATSALRRRLPPSSSPSGPKPVWQSRRLPGRNPSGNPTPQPGRSQLEDTLPFPPSTMSSEPKSLQQAFAGSHQDRSPSAGPSKRWPKPVTPRGEKARPGEGRNQNPSGKWKPVRAATEAKALQEGSPSRQRPKPKSLGRREPIGVKAETKTLLESGSQSPSKRWPKPMLVRNSSDEDLNRRRAEALCLSAPPKTEVSSLADPQGTEVPSIAEGQSFESFFDSSFATQLLRFRCRSNITSV